MVVDDSDEENEVSLGFMNVSFNQNTRDFIDGVFDPCLFLVCLHLLELFFKAGLL